MTRDDAIIGGAAALAIGALIWAWNSGRFAGSNPWLYRDSTGMGHWFTNEGGELLIDKQGNYWLNGILQYSPAMGAGGILPDWFNPGKGEKVQDAYGIWTWLL
jgi:hypothetical protein